MSILLIGGHDRMHCHYKDICGKCGHRLKVFTQYSNNFDKKIGNPDAIIVFTSTVSHKMVNVAATQAKKKDIPIFHCHSSSGDSLEKMIQKLEKKLS